MARERSLVERSLVWSGLVPLPVFLALHLSRELVASFASDVAELLRPAPSAAVILSSWLLVLIPLALHALLGSWLLLTGRRLRPARAEADVAELAVRVSRFTSLIALLFVAYHVREYPLAVLLGEADARDAGLRLVGRLSSAHFGAPLRGVGYLLGLLGTVAHAGLSVHRALLREGLLATPAKRRASARCCAAGGALLFWAGAAAVIRVASGALLR